MLLALASCGSGKNPDGITAATIISRAFLEAVRSAYDAYANNPDAPDTASGATVRAGDEDKNK